MCIYFDDILIDKPPVLGGNSLNIRKLNSFNMFFGKNGCGKSLILRTIRDSNSQDSHYVVPERSGDINFDPGQMNTQFNQEARMNQSRQNIAVAYHRQIVSRIATYFIKRGSSRINDFSEQPSEIEELLNITIPDFSIELKGEQP